MTIENGRKRILRGYRKDRSDWAVLLVEHHEGYLSWADYERNQRLIADNANGKGMMERQRLLRMGADLEAAWHHPAATAGTRKRIIRAVLREVVAHAEDDQIRLLLHWQGGDHTHLTVRKNRRGQTRWAVEPETTDLIRACAR